MDQHQMVTRAAEETVAVVRGITPDQLGEPTPCPEWDVRTLLNHLRQVAVGLALAGRGEPVPNELWGSEVDVDFEAETRTAVEAWSRPEAWNRTVTMGTSEMPAAFVAAMFASDLVIHGWDLARATGQEYRCEDGVADQAYRFVAETGEQGRAMGAYGDPVPVSGSASPLHRAIALSGRDPHWSHP